MSSSPLGSEAIRLGGVGRARRVRGRGGRSQRLDGWSLWFSDYIARFGKLRPT